MSERTVDSLRPHLRPGPPERARGRAEHPAVRRARAHLRERFDRAVPLQELAAVSGLSRFELVRRFHAQTGLTPHGFQTDLRIARARRLLAGGERPAAVAAACGFADQPHLTRVFKRATGITPARYARRLTATSFKTNARPRVTLPAVAVADFDTKLAVLVRDDLAAWQRLNVTAFVVSGVTAAGPAVVGEDYVDADGVRYLPMLRQPVLVFEASADKLTTVKERALRREVPLAVYTAELFATGHDDDNRAAVRAVPTADLDLVGLALRAPHRDADAVLRGLRRHP